MNYKEEGKSLIVQSECNLVNTSNYKDLPFIKISHKIAISILYIDSIVNEKPDRDDNVADIRNKTKILM